VRIAHSGEELAGEPGVRLRFLFPPAGFFQKGPRAEATDNNCAILAVEYGNTSLLLPGDIRVPAERAISGQVRQLAGPERLMVVPHHGSVYSSSKAFLSAAAPTHAVVSVGARNSFGHPHPAILIRYQDQGAELFRTDMAGALEAVSDGARWKLGKAR
jgi:competence protein ComEC